MAHYYVNLRTPFSILFFALAVVVGALVCLSVISVLIGFIRNALFPSSGGKLEQVESVEYDEDLDRGEDIDKVIERISESYQKNGEHNLPAPPPAQRPQESKSTKPSHIHLGDEKSPPRVVTRTPMTTRTDVRKAKRKRNMAKNNAKNNKSPAKPAPANPQKNKRK